MALRHLLDKTFPHHVYAIEPQSVQYQTHGDLWDYLSMEFHRTHQETGELFLPFSLELGSWMWLKKNPRQIFNLLGAFNPLIPHRKKRALRRHLLLMDFLLRAVNAHSKWAYFDAQARQAYELEANDRWYHYRSAAPVFANLGQLR